MGWYGVRALFRLVAVGKPKWTDRHFDPASTLVEDRVVLFQATDFDHAIKQAEAEARRYCKTVKYTNIYGQSVRLRHLQAIDAFSMYDSPRAGGEVFSSTAIVPNSLRDARVVTTWFGKKERLASRSRNKFIDGKILTKAFTAMRQSDAKGSARPAGRKKVRSQGRI
jgi:hypothetical protein